MTQPEELKIRIATPDDLDEIMKLVELASEENGFLNPSMQKILHEIWPALNQHNGLIGVIGDPGGIIQAGVLLRIGQMWYSDSTVLEERIIFTHPDYRSAKGGRAKRLCEFSKHVSDTLGLPLLIGVLSNSRTEAKIRMYERQFGKPSGTFFLYGAKTGEPLANRH